MEFPLFFLVLTVLWKTSSSLRCYTCEPEPSYYTTKKSLCKDFDGSERYVVECPTSTMCFKRETTLNFGNGVTSVIVHRGCASQSLGQEQVKINGKWHRKTIVHDVYTEECKEDTSDMEKPTKTINCHCRGDYCNASIANNNNLKLFILILFVHILR